MLMHQNRKHSHMKLSKSILAAVVVGASIASISSSCTKEDLRKNNQETEELSPVCGFGESGEGEITYEDCPGCGMG